LDEAGSLLVFVPLSLYMSVGFFFLVMGLFSLVRIRSVMKRDGTKTDKLEKLIGKIGRLVRF
jgi:frizzled protein 4